ncbi:MAG: cytochrome b N-terminal domain-containing protein [Myxococcales bacterium]|nr:MAG: cytochrome b N-terminal domain-containing protein [Myxococcales bacterium]
MMEFRQWLQARTGYQQLLDRYLHHERPGGASWSRVFGRVLVLLLVIQLFSGVLLMLVFVPGVQSAWPSVMYIQSQMTLGWFVRGVHHYGASAVMIVLGLHFVQTATYGAYKAPRELSWWFGLALMALLLGMALSGYLLPWDQKAYWASKVTTSVIGGLPFVGRALKSLLLGGDQYGQLMLSRFFALHVAILPAFIVLLVVMHLLLFQRHGPLRRYPYRTNPAKHSQPYYPFQLVRNQIASVITVGAIIYFTFKGHGAPLDAPADPSVVYPPRPEWYFRFLFQLFKILPSDFESIAAALIPVLVAAFLIALPFLDHEPKMGLRPRLKFILPIIGAGLFIAGLTVWSFYDDLHDVDFLRSKASAAKRAERAYAIAQQGVPPEGPLFMLANDPVIGGQDLYRRNCQQCHILHGEGERQAPDHTAFASREWIMALLEKPQANRFFAKTDIDDMPSQKKLGQKKLTAIVEFLFSLGQEPTDLPVNQELVEEGARLFQSKCMGCHRYEGDGDYDGLGGPDLSAYGSAQWIYRQTADPEHHYGELNEMPAFAEDLSESELRVLADFLRFERAQ